MALIADRLVRPDNVVRLFVGGDIITGGAIDRLFATHNEDDFGKPDYRPSSQKIELSAQLHGAVAPPLRHDYVWGIALEALEVAQPDFRLANLETSVTTCADWERKDFNFRMHPDNIGCLTALGLDCVSLANNHVLDFGVDGLRETIATLRAADIGCCGAGENQDEAGRPHVHVLPGGQRILVFSWGFRDSHLVFSHWAAGPAKPGIQFIPTIDEAAIRTMVETIDAHRLPGDIVIASLHWGHNWARSIPDEHRRLARVLIDSAGVDLIHGHSSHHVLPVETYRGKLIFYGCGDLINDTEGHPKCRAWKGHLGALYFVDINPQTRRLTGFTALPVERQRFRLELPSREDASWMQGRIGRALQRTVGQPARATSAGTG